MPSPLVPISLEKISPTMELGEALSRTIDGSASHDVSVYVSTTGEMQWRLKGKPIDAHEFGRGHWVALQSAHNSLLNALRSGELRSYVGSGGQGVCYHLNRAYWFGRDQFADSFIGDEGINEAGLMAGEPIMLAQTEFDAWAARHVEAVEAAPVDDPLDIWLALEIRRCRVEYGKRDVEDAELVRRVGQKNGPRVKLILRWMEKIAVPLVDAILAKAREFQSPPEALARARASLAEFVQEMGSAATQMAYFVGSETLAKGPAVKGRIDKLQHDLAGAFRLASADPLIPVLTPGRLGRFAEKRPAHRPLKRPAALMIFAARLRDGSAQQTKADEARKIARAWVSSDPPTPESVAGWIAPFHKHCQWREGQIANGEFVAAEVDAKLEADKVKKAG